MLTCLTPFTLLLAVEVGLRAADVCGPLPLFIDAPRAAGWLQVNPGVVSRFVPNPAQTPKLWIRPVPFQARKPPGALRIFVQGGSTAAGYPYGYGASPAGMLQQRLQRSFPERRVEVVTTAVSAVNSYTLLDFSQEILEHQPDAVVLYAGHNEYLGLLGVGSSFSVGMRPLTRAFLALRQVRLFQLLRQLVARLTPRPESRDGRTLMERVVAHDRIPYGSVRFERGLDQYRANLRELLRRYREAGVPVFVGTLVSNERDQPPFISGHGEGVDIRAWRPLFDAGLERLAAGDARAALDSFDLAIALDPLHADGHFGRARALEALGRFVEARESYVAARDRDELRFRASQEINVILREVAAEQGARVVEVEQAFRRASGHGFVGRELMLEHLHPNLEGYFVMADAFHDALRAHGLGVAWGDEVSEQQARAEIPVTEVDRLYGAYRIAALTSGWPFRQQPVPFRLPAPKDRVEAIAQGFFEGRTPWPDAMRELLAHHQMHAQTSEAARVAALLAEAFPHRLEDQRVAAELLRRSGRSDLARYGP